MEKVIEDGDEVFPYMVFSRMRKVRSKHEDY